MSGLLVPETCCPAVADAAAGAELPEQPALQEPGCCERVVVANAKAPAVSPDGAGQLPAGPAAIVIARLPPPVWPPSAPDATLAFRRRADPRPFSC